MGEGLNDEREKETARLGIEGSEHLTTPSLNSRQLAFFSPFLLPFALRSKNSALWSETMRPNVESLSPKGNFSAS